MIFNALYGQVKNWRSLWNGPIVAGIVLTPLFAWLVLTQPPQVVLGVVLGLGAFVIISRKPELGLYFMILAVPAQDKLSVSLGGARLTLVQAAVLVTLAGWFLNRTTYKKPLVRRPAAPLLPFFLLYIAAQVASLLVATSLPDALSEISRWGITFFAYLLTTNIIETRRQFWTLVICLVVGSAAEAALGVVQTRLGVGPESFAINQDLTRAFGTFEFPNPFAGYLEMALPLLVALAFWNWRRRNAAMKIWLQLGEAGQVREVERRELRQIYIYLALLLPACALVVLAVVASYSRGAWLGLIAAVLMMIAIRGSKSAGIWVVLLLVGLFGVLALQNGVVASSQAQRLTSITEQFTPFDVRERVPNDETFAVIERMAMWQAGGNMFLYSPWLGIGVGNFTAVYNNFNMPMWIYSRGHAHNYYIHAAAETGIIGLTAYLALVGTAYGIAWRTYRRTKEVALRYVAWGGVGILTAVLVHNLVENLHVLNLGIQWSSVLALFYLIPLLEKNQQQLPE